jgi:hypothetical protein
LSAFSSARLRRLSAFASSSFFLASAWREETRAGAWAEDETEVRRLDDMCEMDVDVEAGPDVIQLAEAGAAKGTEAF